MPPKIERVSWDFMSQRTGYYFDTNHQMVLVIGYKRVIGQPDRVLLNNNSDISLEEFFKYKPADPDKR